MTDWMTLPELAQHSRLSLSTLQRAMTRRDNKLPSYLVGGRRLVRKDEYDRWATGRLGPRRGPKLRKSNARVRRGIPYATAAHEPLDSNFQWRTPAPISSSRDD